jgi:hypothetical protein
VERTALSIDGVKAATVDQRKGEAVITYDRAKTNPDAIAQTIAKKTGFSAEVAQRR